MDNIRQQILIWKDNFIAPQKNDVLLNLQEGKNAIAIPHSLLVQKSFNLPLTSPFIRLYKQHKKSIKDAGAPIFGVIKDMISFEFKEKAYVMPFLLAGANIHKNHFSSSFEITVNEDLYVHPGLLHILGLDDVPIDWNQASIFLSNKGLKHQFVSGVWVANFHPHRFALQKEFSNLLEVSSWSSSLRSLFGLSSKKDTLPITSPFLFPADVSQEDAIFSAKSEDIVIQGPPGTGKSQVIGNFVGNSLMHGQTSLLVAEKPVALKVVYDNLKIKNLHYFCGVYHHRLRARDFVYSLKETWEYLEQLPQKHIEESFHSNLLRDGLDLSLQRLRQPNLIGGWSFLHFYKQFPKITATVYLNKKPTFPIWEGELPILKKLQKDGFPLFSDVLNIRITELTPQRLSKIIQQMLDLLQDVSNSNLCVNSLHEELRLSQLVSLFFYENQPLSEALLTPNSPEQKNFKRFYNRFVTYSESIERLKEEQKIWKKEMSLSALKSAKMILSSPKRISIKRWKVKQVVQSKMIDTHINLLPAVVHLLELKEAERKRDKLKQQLRNKGWPDHLVGLNYIFHVIKEVASYDENRIKKVAQFSLKEKEFRINKLSQLQEIQQLIRLYFQPPKTIELLSFFQKLQVVLPHLIAHWKLWSELSSETLTVLQTVDSLQEAEMAIAYSHGLDFKGRFPELAQLSELQLHHKIQQILQVEEKESNDYGLQISNKIKAKFEYFHQLLQTPSGELIDAQKNLKKELRKGKAILVKSFGKKRVFPSVLELLNSEARIWIRLLHPFFLCSPYSLAKSIPLDYNFDWVLFDEASQIPLSHAVGAVQRARRVVISGDQEQMQPTSYFRQKHLQELNVLHQATFYWQKKMLTHHYRSQHPDLIEFSNRYFYGGKLQTFPAIGMNFPIELIQVDGIYERQVNQEEAKQVAAIVIQKIKKNIFDFGLVAFSQAQLNAILSFIPLHLYTKLEGKEGVFLQSLEYVQGDQCNHLIISMGYGKDKEGNFYKRFGPLNIEQGHRRLNVLMSRAQSKITFVRSVLATDFQLSLNIGVEMLRKLMLFLEEKKQVEERQSKTHPLTSNSYLITLEKLPETNTAKELVDHYQIYKERGWEIKFDFQGIDWKI